MKLRKYILTVMIGITAMTVLSSCANKENAVKGQPDQSTQEIFAMDTYMSLTAYGSNSEEAVNKAVQEINRLDAMFSVGNADSDVTKINENGSGEVSEETAFIMNRAMQVSEKTNGAFDITIYPLMELWGFTTKNYRVPESSEIAEALKGVSYTNVSVNGQQVALTGGSSIDLGGIAKGYTSSRVIQIMKDCGIEHAIVNLGGNVQVLGTKTDGSDWRVAIQNPASENSYLGILSTTDKAVITSGGYERYFEQDGQVYHHIIDTQTGYPSDSDLTSVTIVYSDGTTADALSTALFAMGLDGAKELYRSGDIDFDMILFDGSRVYVSEGIASGFSTDMNKEIITRQP
jgi:thiamine biosynthesis lipoprotein